MQTKTRVEYALRHDGKFNIWRKEDIVGRPEPLPPLYGTWEIVAVRNTREQAIEVWRELRVRR